MPILDPSHDHMHPVEGESAWSESYYFNGYDPDADVGLYTRIGIRPNEGTMDVMLACWQPDNQIAFIRAKREQKEMCESPLEVDGVRYECREEGKRWQITADTEARLYHLKTREHRKIPFSLDLEFESLIPMIGVDGQGTPQNSASASASTSQSTGKGHLEQAGRWSGWVEADGVRQTFGERARGNRAAMAPMFPAPRVSITSPSCNRRCKTPGRSSRGSTNTGSTSPRVRMARLRLRPSAPGIGSSPAG